LSIIKLKIMIRHLKIWFVTKLPIITLTVFSMIFIFFFYGKVLKNPDGWLFSDSGDGIKNYFTYAYHISHDSTYLRFEGMNYPYGEHFLYTDCHPVLANLLKALGHYFPLLPAHSIGLLNLLMIVSIFLTFFVSFFLLLEMKTGRWLSVIFAMSITLLAPQIFRLGGHYALSYSLAIPLSWFILLRFYNSQKTTGYFTLLMLNNLFWLFIHAYLGVIIIFFLLSIVVIKKLAGDGEKNQSQMFFAGIIALIFPLIFYYLVTLITDPYSGRTDNPSGFFLYNAEFDDVFIPHHPPLRPLLDFITGHAIKLKWEAWSYVGFSGTLLFLVLIISFTKSILRKRFSDFSGFWFANKNLNISLLAAFIVLLFAMGFPFKQFPGLIEWLPFIKQFRATGRFAWPFYFAFMAFAASVSQTYFGQSKKPLVAGLLIAAVFILNITEAIPYHRQVSANISRAKNLFVKKHLPMSFRDAIATINPDDYQAIITLPFYYYGSESFTRPRDDNAVRTSLILSFHTGIPNVCTNLTRTPVEASKNIVQLVSPDFYPKAIRADIKNKKPFLVIKTKKELSHYEKLLLDKAKKIGDFEDFSLYDLQYTDLFANTAINYFDLYYHQASELFPHDGFFVSDTASFFYYQDFENQLSNTTFRGHGACKGNKKGKNTFAEFSPGTFKNSETYHFSIWMYNGMKDALNLWFRFLVEEWNPKNDTWQSTTFFPEHSEVIYGNWSLVEGDFTIQSSENYVYFVSKGKDNSKALLLADDLLIQKAGIDVFKLHNDTLFYNNHIIILPAKAGQ